MALASIGIGIGDNNNNNIGIRIPHLFSDIPVPYFSTFKKKTLTGILPETHSFLKLFSGSAEIT
jgi:hypothetical protein